MEEKCWHMSTPAPCALADALKREMKAVRCSLLMCPFFYLKTNGAHYCHTNLHVELRWGSQDSLILHVCIPLILIIEIASRWSRRVKTHIASCYTFTKTAVLRERLNCF